jgi:hypothetical protein
MLSVIDGGCRKNNRVLSEVSMSAAGVQFTPFTAPAPDAMETMEQVNSVAKTVSQRFKRSIRPAPVPFPEVARPRLAATPKHTNSGVSAKISPLKSNISSRSRGALKSPLEAMSAGSIIRQDGVRSWRRCAAVEQRVCQTGPRVQPS